MSPEEQKQVVEVPTVAVLHAGNTTQTLAPQTPKQTAGTPSAGVFAGITVFGQRYGKNGLTREWVKKN